MLHATTTKFYILFSFKTEKGIQSYAQFHIGNDRSEAYSLFRQLKHSDEVSEKSVLFVDFMETIEGLPVNVDMITCSLDELAENCKIISKALFRRNVCKAR